MTSTNRLFVVIDLPCESKTLLGKLNPCLAGLRCLPPEQLHLTLSFLGEVETPKQKLLTEALSEVRVPPFFLPLQRLG